MRFSQFGRSAGTTHPFSVPPMSMGTFVAVSMLATRPNPRGAG